MRAASNGTRTAHEIRDTYNCNVTVRRFKDVLRKAPQLKHKKTDRPKFDHQAQRRACEVR